MIIPHEKIRLFRRLGNRHFVSVAAKNGFVFLKKMTPSSDD